MAGRGLKRNSGNSSSGGGGLSWKLHDFAGFVLLILVIGSLYATIFENGKVHHHQEDQIDRKSTDQGKNVRDEYTNSCGMFSGRWVYDNESYPLYNEEECSFVEEDFACVRYGRPDLTYQNWRWQPNQCNLPRFDGKELMEKMRGKKVVYVGDSLIRNQWMSMLCMIEKSLAPSSSRSVIKTDNWFIFKAKEYKATIAFYWSPFLVESNNDHPHNHRLKNRIIKIKSIEKYARFYVVDHANNYAHVSTYLWGSFNRSDAIYKKEEMKPRYYEMALNTWSDWLEVHINRTRTKLFFMSLSPFHEVGEGWDGSHNCYNTSEPIWDDGYWGFTTDRRIMQVAESTIEKLHERGINMQYLNITQMSDRRIDGHSSIYRKFWHILSEEQLKDPRSYSDCVHWCLPGVPDIWNHILYAYLTNINDDDQQLISHQ